MLLTVNKHIRIHLLVKAGMLPCDTLQRIHDVRFNRVILANTANVLTHVLLKRKLEVV